MSQVDTLIRTLAKRAGTTAALVERPTVTFDAARTPIKTWATIGTYPCVIDVTSGTERIQYGGERNRRFTKGYFPSGTDIDEQDRVTVSGSTYDVQHVDTPANMLSNDRLSLVVVDLEETLP